MEWREIGNQVAKVAPLLGGLLGGPLGAAAGEIAATFLGTDPTPEAIQKELATNPEAFVKLREAELKNQAMLQELKTKEVLAKIEADTEEYRIQTADTQNARSRDTQLKLNGHHNFRADIMLGMAFTCVVIIIICLFKFRVSIPSEVLTIMNITLGGLMKCIYDAFQFEFGSSRGSKEKDLK